MGFFFFPLVQLVVCGVYVVIDIYRLDSISILVNAQNMK